ncbi:MAG: ABC transporter permease [Sulfuriferula multivorans]|uniref:Transport permease protein n=1 Tax=Sulfuriferula multivorans TaxID=1559896 RepID=A0A7C9NUB1_9PROT|nr:ABC transporter permease [Sulfuriferula multivorans]
MTVPPLIVIANGSRDKDYWVNLWRHREMLFFLVWRDILVRYKQTLVGVSWVVIRPFLTMMVFTVVFGNIANLPSNGLPYPLLVFTGMLPWFFFSSALTECSNSLVGNSNMLSKIYFPRLIIPISTILVCGVDYLVSILLLIGMLAWYQHLPDWRILFLPVFSLFTAMTAFGLGLWAAALNVRYRDFRHLIPFVLQLGIYISPVGYATNLIPEKWRALYWLNPMVGIIDGFRWSVLGQETAVYWPSVGLALLTSVGVLWSGLWYFRRSESTFADVI